MKRIIVTTLVISTIIAVVVLAAHSFDLIGALRRMNGR